jgi:glycosyltransferase involved in cell wall biosynthesis
MTTPRARVVHLINHLGRGGTERQLYLLLAHRDAERFEHRVVVFNPSPNNVWDRELAACGVEVTTLPTSCHGTPRRLAYLWRHLRPFRPQVLHSWSVHDNPYAGVLGRLLGTPVRWGSLRSTMASEGVQRLPAFYRVLMLRAVSRIVVNCQRLADELTEGGTARQRVIVLPNCALLPPPEAPPADLSSWGIAADAPVVGVVANLHSCKNLLMFVRAMGRVLPRHPRSYGVIVGQPVPSDPDYTAEIEAEIERQGLAQRLNIVGFYADVPAMMVRFQVVCSTSDREGMPNVVLEAMAAARPVVGTRVGGTPELVEEAVSGYLVEPDDDAAMAERVDRLLTEPGLAAEMGRSGRRRVAEKHGCRHAAQRLEGLYREALDGP